jgi:hypothetical protein
MKPNRFPRPPDLLLALVCSLFIAAEMRSRISAGEASSAVIRYLQEPWVLTIHNTALCVWFLTVAISIAWLIRPDKKSLWTVGLISTAWVAWILNWIELVYAPWVSRGKPYTLSEMPLGPVVGYGLLGAGLLLGYIIIKVPTKSRAFIWPKLGLALCAGLVQVILWQRWAT